MLRCSFCHKYGVTVQKYCNSNTCLDCLHKYSLLDVSYREISDIRKLLNRRRKSAKELETALEDV